MLIALLLVNAFLFGLFFVGLLADPGSRTEIRMRDPITIGTLLLFVVMVIANGYGAYAAWQP